LSRRPIYGRLFLARPIMGKRDVIHETGSTWHIAFALSSEENRAAENALKTW